MEYSINKDTLWVIHIGNNDRIGLRALNEGFICIGWTKMGDLSDFNSRDKMRSAMERTYPNWKSRRISSSYGQPFRFAHKMEENDLVIYPVKSTGEVAIGKITGEYKFSDDSDLIENDYANFRKVEWLKTVSRTLLSQAALHSFGSFLSVSTSDDYLEEVISILEGEIQQPDDSQVENIGADTDEDDDASSILYETATQETEDYLLKAWQRTGYEFERVVGALFEGIGYSTDVTSQTRDHGIDVIAHPDPLGLERPYIKIQVKSGTGSISEREVNQLKGLLNNGERGIFISLGKFTRDAEAIERSSSNLTLIGPQKFVKLFLDHYNDIDPEWRAKYPLKQVYVPFS